MQLSDILSRWANREGALLPILHEVQAEFGHVSEESIGAIAAALNLSRAEVHGVVSFYHDFRTSPDPRPVVKLCRAEACQARGSEALVETIGDVAGIKVGTVYCLGLCSVGPNAMVGEVVHGRLDTARLAALVENLA